MAETFYGNILITPETSDSYGAKGSGTLAEGRLVELDTDITDTQTLKYAINNSPSVLGFVQNEWESGDLLTFYRRGVARLEDSGSGIAYGARVGSAGSGKIKTYASGSVVGICWELTNISASAFGQVLVDIVPANSITSVV